MSVASCGALEPKSRTSGAFWANSSWADAKRAKCRPSSVLAWRRSGNNGCHRPSKSRFAFCHLSYSQGFIDPLIWRGRSIQKDNLDTCSLQPMYASGGFIRGRLSKLMPEIPRTVEPQWLHTHFCSMCICVPDPALTTSALFALRGSGLGGSCQPLCCSHQLSMNRTNKNMQHLVQHKYT